MTGALGEGDRSSSETKSAEPEEELRLWLSELPSKPSFDEIICSLFLSRPARVLEAAGELEYVAIAHIDSLLQVVDVMGRMLVVGIPSLSDAICFLRMTSRFDDAL